MIVEFDLSVSSIIVHWSIRWNFYGFMDLLSGYVIFCCRRSPLSHWLFGLDRSIESSTMISVGVVVRIVF